MHEFKEAGDVKEKARYVTPGSRRIFCWVSLFSKMFAITQKPLTRLAA
nr:hypothetical protein [Sporomusa silvacetica]